MGRSHLSKVCCRVAQTPRHVAGAGGMDFAPANVAAALAAFCVVDSRCDTEAADADAGGTARHAPVTA